MTKRKIRIATRKSPLALWQTEFVKQELLAIDPSLEIELIGMTTEGDRTLDTPLYTFGGKGLFLKELEKSLLEHKTDLAVHSLKDVPASLPADLEIGAICKRGDPRDAFLSLHYSSLHALPAQARIGTSSLRRTSQIYAMRPDVTVESLRGNVNSRLEKLVNGNFAAIILAAVGIERLQMTEHLRHIFSIEEILPAIGQGVICIECRRDDDHIKQLIQPLHDEPTATCITAERAISKKLDGGCQIPLAAYASINKSTLNIKALISNPRGTQLLRAERTGDIHQAEQLGNAVADELIALGAKAILQSL